MTLTSRTHVNGRQALLERNYVRETFQTSPFPPVISAQTLRTARIGPGANPSHQQRTSPKGDATARPTKEESGVQRRLRHDRTLRAKSTQATVNRMCASAWTYFVNMLETDKGTAPGRVEYSQELSVYRIRITIFFPPQYSIYDTSLVLSSNT